MAAPLALSEGREQKQIPCGNDRKKSKSNGKYRDLSIALRSGRDDRVVGCEEQATTEATRLRPSLV